MVLKLFKLFKPFSLTHKSLTLLHTHAYSSSSRKRALEHGGRGSVREFAQFPPHRWYMLVSVGLFFSFTGLF